MNNEGYLYKETKLKPCAHCGGPARFDNGIGMFDNKFIVCNRCGIRTPDRHLEKNVIERIWRSRVKLINKGDDHENK